MNKTPKFTRTLRRKMSRRARDADRSLSPQERSVALRQLRSIREHLKKVA